MILRLLKKIYQYRFVCGLYLFILLALIANAFHTQFPDEFDNIFGGFLINHGKLPFVGFFTHHNPGAYYLASLITLFSGRSFVWFRLIFAFVLFIAYILSYILLKTRLKKQPVIFFLFYGLLITIGATYWWGQMLLSETIVGTLLAPVFILVILKSLYKIKYDIFDLWIVSISTFFALFVSLTYIYFIPIFDIVVLYLYFKDNLSFSVKKIVKPIFIFILPYIIFFIYLLITGSLYEFYFQSIYYNVNYYIYNFPIVAGTVSHHPIRYAISIAQHTTDNLFGLLTQVSTFNFSYPFNISLALGNVTFLIYLFIKRQYASIILYVSMILYTNARSEPLDIKETDFHATVYIMLTLISVSFLFFRLKEELNENIAYFNRLILTFLFVILSTYWFFNSYFLFNKFIDKAYGKFMGRDPLIYDRSQAAPIINRIVSENDYYWIGPFELQELLFIKGRLASKYFWFLPANSRNEKIKREITADLTKNRPKVIVFKKWWANFGVKPKDFNTTIVNFLDENYFFFGDLNKEKMTYRSKVERERNFDFETEFFFDKERKEEIVKELLEKGMIEKL